MNTTAPTKENPMTYYQERIAEMTTGVDPRHIEAWMRLDCRTLDELSAAEFKAEAQAAVEMVDIAGTAASETLAASFGL